MTSRKPAPRQMHGRFLGQVVAAKQEHAGDQHQYREQVARSTEQQECDVGEPRAGGAHAVRHDLVAAGDAECGIRRAVAQEGEQQNQAQASQDPERRLTKPFDARHEKGLERGAGFGFIQVTR